MRSEDADVAVPILAVLGLIAGLGLYHEMSQPKPTAPKGLAAIERSETARLRP